MHMKRLRNRIVHSHEQIKTIRARLDGLFSESYTDKGLMEVLNWEYPQRLLRFAAENALIHLIA